MCDWLLYVLWNETIYLYFGCVWQLLFLCNLGQLDKVNGNNNPRELTRNTPVHDIHKIRPEGAIPGHSDSKERTLHSRKCVRWTAAFHKSPQKVASANFFEEESKSWASLYYGIFQRVEVLMAESRLILWLHISYVVISISVSTLEYVAISMSMTWPLANNCWYENKGRTVQNWAKLSGRKCIWKCSNEIGTRTKTQIAQPSTSCGPCISKLGHYLYQKEST